MWELELGMEKHASPDASDSSKECPAAWDLGFRLWDV